MSEDKKRFPNVSLGGKLNKQKGSKGPGHLRYREKDQDKSLENK